MEALLFNLILKVLQFIFGWLFKMLRPIIQSIFNILWPVIRMLLILAGLVAGILVLRQILARNPDLIRRLRS